MRKDTPALKLTKEEKSAAVPLIKTYIKENLDTEAGDLAAGMLIDFISEKLGGYYYNMGVADSMKYMSGRIEDLYLLMKD